MKKHADLPFASTLCGSCSNVCPVKINIHDQLYKWRQEIVKEGYATSTKAIWHESHGLDPVLARQTGHSGSGGTVVYA